MTMGSLFFLLSLFAAVGAFHAPSVTFSRANNVLRASFKNSNNEKSDCDLSRRTFLSTVVTATLSTATLLPVYAREPPKQYLTEPTPEFQESERQRTEFRKAQLLIKNQFVTVLDRLTQTSNSEEEICKDLDDLTDLVIKTEGLPLGIKRPEIIKAVRSKKNKGYWPTNAEIAYQRLTTEIAYQQSPNHDKDSANRL